MDWERGAVLVPPSSTQTNGEDTAHKKASQGSFVKAVLPAKAGIHAFRFAWGLCFRRTILQQAF